MLPAWVISLPKLFAYESPSFLVCDGVSWVRGYSHTRISHGLAFYVFGINEIILWTKNTSGKRM